MAFSEAGDEVEEGKREERKGGRGQEMLVTVE